MMDGRNVGYIYVSNVDLWGLQIKLRSIYIPWGSIELQVQNYQFHL